MDSLNFSRSPALNNIPQRKLQEKLADINNLDLDLKSKNVKLIAINRYAESNIPIEYWNLKMEKDFKGDPRLLEKYKAYTNDLKKSYMDGVSICFAGSHGLGKQFCLETELPTPIGFVKLKDLKEGDELFDEQGNICHVTKLHPINLSPESYRITFDDGSTVDACADHLWATFTHKNRKNKEKYTIKSTKEILNTMYVGEKQKTINHSIKCANPLNYNEKKLLLDPYLFGLWLGNGDIHNGTIESTDLEIFDSYIHHILQPSLRFNSKSVTVKIDGLFSALDLMKLIKKSSNDKNYQKMIPNDYLYASFKQRLSILQGLLDSNGLCNNNGMVEFCTTYTKLAEHICQLIKSLGIKINESRLDNKRYRITFTTRLPVFRLKRKLSKIRLVKKQLSRIEHRFIVNISRIQSKPMRCITVDSSSHLFLITRSFIPTHNTMTAACILKKACNKNYCCLYTTLSDIVNVLTQTSGENKYLSRRELALVDFLVIDEFDSRFMQSENVADLYARTLEGIFRTRSQNKLPTLMCTNSPNILESFHGSLKVSLDSLMKSYLKTFPVFGDDFRKKKV